jgi:hypothetical protein
MDRGGVPGPEGKNNRRRQRTRGAAKNRRGRKGGAGLEVLERDGHWHVYGTVRAKGRSIRVRKSTELPALPETRRAAEDLRRQWESELIDTLVSGRSPTVPVAVAADQFLRRRRKRALNARDVAIVQEIVAAFGERRLTDVPEGDWVAFVDNRNAKNKAETRERYITGVRAFLAWCAKKPRAWLNDLPPFERDQAARKPKHRRARRVADLTPDLIMLMIANCSPHLAGQLVTEWSTGGRLSSILFGCRLCDLLIVKDDAAGSYRGQITFHDTKTGEPVVAALHPWACARLLGYLEWRGDLHDREAPLFVTPRIDRVTGKKLPYSDRGRGAWSGHNKTAWNAMKRRTVRALRAAGAREALQLWRTGARDDAREAVRRARDRAHLVAQVTQHWFRHLLATTIMAQTGNLRAAMDQGGWLTAESVLGYTHDVPEVRRRLVADLPIGTPAVPAKAKKEQA